MKVIITGGTKGIGRALVEAFVQKGAIVATCARNEQDLQDLQSAFGADKVLVRVVDVSDKKAIQSYGDWLASQWQSVDILINNAGWFAQGGLLEEPDGRLEEMMAINVYSAYYMTRVFKKMLDNSNKAHIFNICSVASTKIFPMGGTYSITKYALLGFSRALRMELKDQNIKVTSVMPGATWSNSWAGVDLPEDRLMAAADVAASVVAAYELADNAVVEEIVMRPILGDL